jgi:hypothetical protein
MRQYNLGLPHKYLPKQWDTLSGGHHPLDRFTTLLEAVNYKMLETASNQPTLPTYVLGLTKYLKSCITINNTNEYR